jgi:hypothetical protein
MHPYSLPIPIFDGPDAGSVVLTNELGKKLPGDFLEHVPGGVSAAYSAIPQIKTL